MAFLALCIFVLVCLIGRMFVDHDYDSVQGSDEITEDDMSPVVELLMFDDYMEDGDLDIF